MIGTVLSDAWRIYWARFGTIAAIVLIVWVPCELLISYCDSYVFADDNYWASFRLNRFVDNFIGIIATAAVIRTTFRTLDQKPITAGEALSEGLGAWGRLWWTNVVSGFAMVIALVLLIIPGIYLGVRICLIDAVAVLENASGADAIKRSFELTRNRFWEALGLGAILIGPLLVLGVVIAVIGAFVPGMDFWLASAAQSLLLDLLAAFATVALTAYYCRILRVLEESEPEIAS